MTSPLRPPSPPPRKETNLDVIWVRDQLGNAQVLEQDLNPQVARLVVDELTTLHASKFKGFLITRPHKKYHSLRGVMDAVDIINCGDFQPGLKARYL